jgi:hypothetical protein
MQAGIVADFNRRMARIDKGRSATSKGRTEL